MSIAKGKYSKIHIYEGDNPGEKAHNFCLIYRLNGEAEVKLNEVIYRSLEEYGLTERVREERLEFEEHLEKIEESVSGRDKETDLSL